MISILNSLKKLSPTSSNGLKSVIRCFTLTTNTEDYYDVVVCGGGLVGGAMATAFATSKFMKNKKILLLDQASKPKTVDEHTELYNFRVIAVSPSSKELLSKFGVWDDIGRMRDVKKMQVWEDCSDSMITFGEKNMEQNLCHIIENNLIINALFKLLKSGKNENVELLFESKIKNVFFPNEYERLVNGSLPYACIELDNGRKISSQLVIGADGAQSVVAEQAKFDKLSNNYHQSAIVATLQFSEPCENVTAWQRFLTTGPIALLPLDDLQSSLVWTTSKEEANRLVHLENEDFCDAVNNAFNYEEKNTQISNLLSQFENTFLSDSNFQLPPKILSVNGAKAKFPLGISHSNHYAKPRVVLIGDAAHRVHPLAGQGANLGFGDVACLIKTLENAVHEGKDLGNLLHLIDYESTRQKHNVPVMATIHALNGLYSTDFVPIVALRSLGLSLVNNNKTIKNIFMQGAMS